MIYPKNLGYHCCDCKISYNNKQNEYHCKKCHLINENNYKYHCCQCKIFIQSCSEFDLHKNSDNPDITHCQKCDKNFNNISSEHC